jgi:TonB family protein
MRIFVLICLAVATASAVPTQSPSIPMSELSKDPRGMLAAALPLYDFGAATMSPWHFKGSYQLYDESGDPTQQGTYEYWWQSPKVYRSSWNRGNATRTEWHTQDGKTVYKATGERLFYFEHNLEKFLFSPVPDPATLASAGIEINADQLEIGKTKLPCAEIKARMRSDGTTPMLIGVPEGDYCFDTAMPVLRIEYLFHSVSVEFNKLAKTQGRFLAADITVADGRHRLLTFNAGTADGIPNGDAALVPPADATPMEAEEGTLSPSQSKLEKKVFPVYPQAAKATHAGGVVLLDAMIGKDGRVRDVRVLSTPSRWLVSASEDAVGKWQYAPLVVDGQPEEVNTIIVVFFRPGY